MSDKNSENSSMSSISDKLGIAMLSSVWLYLVICSIALLYLVFTIPITGTDIESASWMSHSTSTYPSGTLATITGISCIVVGLVMWNIRGFIFLFPGLCLGVMGILSGQEENILRNSIWLESAKIGCYVESLECDKMLGIENSSKPSMYEITSTGQTYAKWYVERRKRVGSWLTPIGIMPGISILASPFIVLNSEELKRMIKAQRKSVEQMLDGTANNTIPLES
jgi:hypothetical protein